LACALNLNSQPTLPRPTLKFLQYITLDDILVLVGDDDIHTEEELRLLWTESMKSVDCTSQHIAYDSFVLLMKGPSNQAELPVPSLRLLGSLQNDEFQQLFGCLWNFPLQKHHQEE
jgi:hypothetical protein